MECSLCEYKWCWTCGLPLDHVFHKLVIGSVLCDYVNTFCFGFEQKFNFHILLKILITFLLICLLPLILEFITVFLMCHVIYRYCCCNGKRVCFCISRSYFCQSVTVIILSILEFFIIFPFGLAFGTVLMPFLLLTVLIFILILVARILIQWCITKSTKQ